MRCVVRRLVYSIHPVKTREHLYSHACYSACSHAHVFDGAGDSEDDKSHEVFQLFQVSLWTALHQDDTLDRHACGTIGDVVCECCVVLFQAYEKLFEATIGAFLVQEALSPEDFFNHCRRLLASPRHVDAASNLEILLSALDFDAFCELMTAEALETHSALGAAADMGL